MPTERSLTSRSRIIIILYAPPRPSLSFRSLSPIPSLFEFYVTCGQRYLIGSTVQCPRSQKTRENRLSAPRGMDVEMEGSVSKICLVASGRYEIPQSQWGFYANVPPTPGRLPPQFPSRHALLLAVHPLGPLLSRVRDKRATFRRICPEFSFGDRQLQPGPFV